MLTVNMVQMQQTIEAKFKESLMILLVVVSHD